MDVLNVVLLSIGGTAALLLIAGFLLRKIIGHLLAKDIENYKSSLSHENQIQLEKLKIDLSSTVKDKERRLEKLEELHLLLMELNLKIYVKYHDVCGMVELGCSVIQIREYLGTQDMGQAAFILHSRVKSLAAIYAKNIESDTEKRITALVKEIDEFGKKHNAGIHTADDLNNLREKLNSFKESANKYMKDITNEILKKA